VAEPSFTPSFLKRVAELEKNASAIEQRLLEQTLARILIDPSSQNVSQHFTIRRCQLLLCAQGHF